MIAPFPDLVRIQSQVGRTELRVSGVEIGTGQFQVLPERQAERYIAALAESGRAVVVASQGFDVWRNRLGRVDHFERLFEQT